MAKTAYLTAPPKTTGMPPGVPYIVGNEAAERFSYYGMNSILVVFMTKYLADAQGNLAVMSDKDAEGWYHVFVSAAYFLPLFGAILADAVFGKFRIILWLSIVYCLGHLALALDHTRMGLAIGLALIALGAGGIKPCVSANVGDQFGASNQHLLPRVFNWFYFSINIGSAFSTLLIPWLLDPYKEQPGDWVSQLPEGIANFLRSPRLHSPDVAFGVPGIFMGIATIVFWLGRKKFVHIPPSGREFFDDAVPRERQRIFLWILLPVAFLLLLITGASLAVNIRRGISLSDFAGFPFQPVVLALVCLVVACVLWAIRPVLRYLLIPIPFVAIFWSLWYQNFSSWVVQAESMHRHLFGREWLPAQIQTVNPLFILLALPLFSYVVYPAINKVFVLTPLRKIGMGLFVTVGAFLIVGWIQMRIDAGGKPSIIWQILAFAVLTAGEVLVSPTHLEFAYTQAPQKLKSLVMCTYLIAISLGNQFTAAVNFLIQRKDGTVTLQGASYFFFFVIVMLVTAVLFAIVARFYKGKTYLQDEQP